MEERPMAVYLIRAGRDGQHEQEWLAESRVFINWGEINKDLGDCTSKRDFFDVLQANDLKAEPSSHQNGAGYLYNFVRGMCVGDILVMAVKQKPAFHLARVTGPYEFEPTAEPNRRHARRVAWLKTDVPRSTFTQPTLRDLDRQGSVLEMKEETAVDVEQSIT
jgi:restriction system protein